MDIMQLLNPTPVTVSLGAPLQSQHISAKSRDKHKKMHVMHLLECNVSTVVTMNNSYLPKHAKDIHQRRVIAGRNYLNSKKVLRKEIKQCKDKLAHIQEQLEAVRKENYRYQEEINRLQQKLRSCIITPQPSHITWR